MSHTRAPHTGREGQEKAQNNRRKTFSCVPLPASVNPESPLSPGLQEGFAPTQENAPLNTFSGKSCVCASSLSEGKRCRPNPSLGQPERDPRPPSRLGQRPPRQQKPPSHGSCEVVVKWWSPCVCPETPDHFQAPPGFLGEKEPQTGFGGLASAPRPSPARSIPGAVPTQHSGTCVRAGAETRMALCPPPSLVPLSLCFCSFPFFHGRSAKRLRKLPAAGPSRARSWGPGHTPGQARPCPYHSGRPAPSPAPPPLTPTPQSSRPRGRRPREAAWGAAAPPAGRLSCTPERAVSPPEVLNFTLGGFSGRVGRASARPRLPAGDQGAQIHDQHLAARPFHSPLLRAAPLCPERFQSFLGLPCLLFSKPFPGPHQVLSGPQVDLDILFVPSFVLPASRRVGRGVGTDGCCWKLDLPPSPRQRQC